MRQVLPIGNVQWDAEGWPKGRIMNLISTDANRIQQGCQSFHLIWTSLIQIELTVSLLVVNLGYSAAAGVALLIIVIVLLAAIVRHFTKRRSLINKFTDRRIGLTQEMLQAVRFNKCFAWEGVFLDRLEIMRSAKSKALRSLHFLKSAFGALSMSLPIFANMLIHIVYSATGHVLEPAGVFSSLALINSLRTPLTWLPESLGYFVDAQTALEHVQLFMLSEELAAELCPIKDMQLALQLEGASFTWEHPLEESSDVSN